jgi:hypothetical protein
MTQKGNAFNCLLSGGYSMPPLLQLQYAETDIQEQADQHTSAMHGRLLELMQQHLTQ